MPGTSGTRSTPWAEWRSGLRSELRNLRQQYFLVYGIEGAIAPFLPVVLATQLGLARDEIGTVVAMGGLAILITPVLLGAIADTDRRETRLLAGILVGTAVSLLAMTGLEGFGAGLIVFGLYSLAFEPTKSLQDSLFFTAKRSTAGLEHVSFHQVRVWGTLGFLLPGVALYLPLSLGTGTWIVLTVAAGMAVLSAVNALRLPQPERPSAGSEAATPPGLGRSLGRAWRIARRPRLAVFAIAMLLLQMAMSAYLAFYPLYVTDVVGIDVRWLGLIANLGVGLEVGYMALYGWLIRRLGWRRLMVTSALAQSLRMLALAVWPTVAVVLGTQLVHGYVVITTLVAARVFLDAQAEPGMRHALQGLYTMVVIGGGRVAGSFLGGLVAARDLQWLFGVAAVAAVVAAILLARTFDGDEHIPG